jgi:hypothetical protein
MIITFPDTTDTVDAIRNAIGRPVTFYTEHRVDCSGCSIDPITNTSTNSFCPVCSGVGYIVSYSGVVISGHITHAPSEQMQWVTGGQLVDGDCRVQIKYAPETVTFLGTVSHAEIDGSTFDVRKWMLRGVPSVNRILIDFIQRL